MMEVGLDVVRRRVGTRGSGEVLGQAGGHDVCANYLKWD